MKFKTLKGFFWNLGEGSYTILFTAMIFGTFALTVVYPALLAWIVIIVLLGYFPKFYPNKHFRKVKK